MNELLYARLFKLAAESNLEIQLCFVPTIAGSLVVWKVYAVPLYDIAQLAYLSLAYLSDDQIVERFEELIEQIRKARVEKNEMQGMETEARYFC